LSGDANGEGAGRKKPMKHEQNEKGSVAFGCGSDGYRPALLHPKATRRNGRSSSNGGI